MTTPEAAMFSGSSVVAALAAVVALVIVTGYTVTAFRAVFGGGWTMTILQSMTIGLLYSIAALPAFFAMLLWASGT